MCFFVCVPVTTFLLDTTDLKHAKKTVMTHLNTLSLGLPLRSSLVGGATTCLSWVLESFSAAAMGQPDRL